MATRNRRGASSNTRRRASGSGNARRGAAPKRGVAEGQVGLVYKKDMRGGPLYSIKLEDDDTWYRCGKVEPDVAQGEYIKFEWEDKRGQPTVDLDSIEILEEAEEAPAKSRGRGNGGSDGDAGAAKGGITLKDMRISMQAARNSAIEVVRMAIEHNALDLPAKTKVAERHTALMGIIDNLTMEYFFQTIALTNEDYLAAIEYVENGTEDDPEDYYGDEGEEEYEEEEGEYEEGDD